VDIHLIEITIAALLSGGLVQIINAIVNAGSVKRKDKVSEDSTAIQGYRDLIASYATSFATVNERLSVTEKKLQDNTNELDKYRRETDELHLKLIKQERMIETLERQLEEANEKAETFMQRIVVLEQELTLYRQEVGNGSREKGGNQETSK